MKKAKPESQNWKLIQPFHNMVTLLKCSLD